MANLDNLTNYRQGHLWPPIHSALDVYVRRKAGKAEPYELIWRLIHVWECVTVVLASAATAKIRDLSPNEGPLYRAVRERLFGYCSNEADGKLEKNGAGALDGSIDKWKEILWRIATEKPQGSLFLESLTSFLNSNFSESDDVDATPQGQISAGGGGKKTKPCKVDFDVLIQEWKRACDVPQSVPGGLQDIKQALQSVNNFRNRFAHVPFPAHRLKDIHDAFEKVTEDFFLCAGSGNESCLCGGIQYATYRIQGNGPFTCKAYEKLTEQSFAWGQKNSRSDPTEIWKAAPFILLDEMSNVYVLTRLKDLAGSWEYTRYFSEGDTVRTKFDGTIVASLPVPTQAEYAEFAASPVDEAICDTEKSTEESVATNLPSPDSSEEVDAAIPLQKSGKETAKPFVDKVDECKTYSEALLAISNRNYPPAIDFLTGMVEERPDYHVAWQRLGYAQRESAVAVLRNGSKPDAITLLNKSVNSFKEASKHFDLERQAEAHYHMSKSYHRLYVINRQDSDRELALNEAKTASTISDSSKFQSWCEYLGASPVTKDDLDAELLSTV